MRMYRARLGKYAPPRPQQQPAVPVRVEIAPVVDALNSTVVRLERLVGELALRVEALERRSHKPLVPPQQTADLNPDLPMPTVRMILKHTAALGELGTEDIISQRRDARVVYWRHIAMYLSKKMTTKSLPHIGRYLGFRDHSTVHHGIRKVEKQRLVDDLLDQHVLAVEDSLRKTLAASQIVAAVTGGDHGI